MIEPRIAYLVARRPTGEEIMRLKEITARQQKALEGGSQSKEIDHEFHLLLAKTARSHVLLEIYQALQGLMIRTSELPQKSIEGHEMILRAIEQRDPVVARKAMSSHIRTMELEALSEGLSKGPQQEP